MIKGTLRHCDMPNSRRVNLNKYKSLVSVLLRSVASYHTRELLITIVHDFFVLKSLLNEQNKQKNHDGKKYTIKVYFHGPPLLCNNKRLEKDFARNLHNNGKWSLPGGSLLLSMSIATTLIIIIHIGHSRISFSDFTKLITDRHCVSRRRRSG